MKVCTALHQEHQSSNEQFMETREEMLKYVKQEPAIQENNPGELQHHLQVLQMREEPGWDQRVDPLVPPQLGISVLLFTSKAKSICQGKNTSKFCAGLVDKDFYPEKKKVCYFVSEDFFFFLLSSVLSTYVLSRLSMNSQISACF